MFIFAPIIIYLTLTGVKSSSVATGTIVGSPKRPPPVLISTTQTKPTTSDIKSITSDIKNTVGSSIILSDSDTFESEPHESEIKPTTSSSPSNSNSNDDITIPTSTIQNQPSDSTDYSTVWPTRWRPRRRFSVDQGDATQVSVNPLNILMCIALIFILLL